MVWTSFLKCMLSFPERFLQKLLGSRSGTYLFEKIVLIIRFTWSSGHTTFVIKNVEIFFWWFLSFSLLFIYKVILFIVYCRRIDSNKLQYLQNGALRGLKKLKAVKLDKNPWHCDCRVLYLARWIREFSEKLWDGQMAMCRGPGDLGGHEVGLLRYDDLCEGQWASMLSLSPRLPLRKHRIMSPMNYTTYFNLYLKHIYSTTPKGVEAW